MPEFVIDGLFYISSGAGILYTFNLSRISQSETSLLQRKNNCTWTILSSFYKYRLSLLGCMKVTDFHSRFFGNPRHVPEELFSSCLSHDVRLSWNHDPVYAYVLKENLVVDVRTGRCFARANMNLIVPGWTCPGHTCHAPLIKSWLCGPTTLI